MRMDLELNGKGDRPASYILCFVYGGAVGCGDECDLSLLSERERWSEEGVAMVYGVVYNKNRFDLR